MKRRLGPYQLIERLGTGGMAEVFLAHATRHGDVVHPCVVKVLHDELADDDEFATMLIDEARLVARLRHNNIVSLYDVGRHDQEVFLVMEYVDGRDLHAILARATELDRMLPIPFVVHVARNVCAGLHFAHTRRDPDGEDLRLVHRDVSPPNILVSSLGEVKLIDFGIAKFQSEARERTRSGVIKGKFGYMSPEQAWGEELDQRADVFSVGICLYEMLTGRSLYGQCDDPRRLLRRAREADIEPVSQWREVPASLADIVHRALETNRDDRFPTAHHMERRLSDVLTELAPDYTEADAGAVIDGWFDTGEPAVERRSPRLDNTTAPSTGPESLRVESSGRDVDERTHPIDNVPEDIRKSGRHLRPEAAADTEERSRPNRDDASASEPGNDSDEPVEPTAVITFDDEDTELFDERRISGPQPTITRDVDVARERPQGSNGQDSSKGRRPDQGTQVLEDDIDETAPRRIDDRSPPAIETDEIDDSNPDSLRSNPPSSQPGPGQDNPHRLQQSGAFPSPDVESRQSGAHRSVPPSEIDDGRTASEPTAKMVEKIELDEPEHRHVGASRDRGGHTPVDADGSPSPNRSPEIETGALSALVEQSNSSKGSDESSEPSSKESRGLDRRIQIALAAAFALGSFLYVLFRLLG